MTIAPKTRKMVNFEDKKCLYRFLNLEMFSSLHQRALCPASSLFSCVCVSAILVECCINIQYDVKSGIGLMLTSGFATTHVVVSVRQPLTYLCIPTPYQPPKCVKVHTGENKIDS